MHVHERTAAVGLQDRREGARDVQHAEVVDLQLGARGLDRAVVQRRRAAADAGVRDHERDVGRLRGGRGDLCRIGHVERERHDARILDGDALGIAGGGVDLRGAAVQERAHVGCAEAAVGAGDESDGSFDLHG